MGPGGEFRQNMVLWRRKWQPTRVLAWRILGTAEPGGLPSMESHRVGHDWSDLAAAAAHANKVMLKILQARLQQYVNRELPDVQAGFRKDRGTRGHIANIHWIIEKTESSRKTSTSALLTMPKPLTVWITITVENSERDGNTRPPDLPPEKSVCRSRSNSENWTWNKDWFQIWKSRHR